MNFSIEILKGQARKLRADLKTSGVPVSHSKSLELIAHQHGFRDWNTLHAAAGRQRTGPPFALGDTVRGHYLGQAVTGRVIGLQSRQAADRWRLTIQLDRPVDVVRFESFSAFRSRISATVGSDGATTEKTSDGEPHLRLELS